jgi:hypothetical protein
MKTTYKIIIACILTAIITAFATTYVLNNPDMFIHNTITCDGGIAPDINGCCPDETYTDMGDQGFNCCPNSGGDCFPPIPK